MSVAPSYSKKEAFSNIKRRNEHLASLLETNYFSRFESWIYYISIYLPSVTYPMSMTPLSKIQCDQLDARFLRVLIPRTGYNRNMSRAIRYAPSHMGGANYRSLYLEQGQAMIKQAYKYFNSPSTTIGKLLYTTLSWTQAFLGVSFPILEQPHRPIPPVGPSWLLDLRSFLKVINGKVTLRDQVTPSLLREKDRCIMDIALGQTQWNHKHLRQINACRRYLQACTVADITGATGNRILPHVLAGNDIQPNDKLKVSKFNQRRPAATAWATWRRFLNMIADRQGILRQPLGRWIKEHQYLRHRSTFVYDPVKDRLYSHYEGNLYHRHDKMHPNAFSPRPSGGPRIPSGYPTEVRSMMDYLIPTKNYREAIGTAHTHLQEQMPNPHEWRQQLLSNVTILVTRQELKTHLLEGRLVTCSDGSVLDNKGSYGIVISTTHGTRLARGGGRAPGYYMNSFRSEAYGVLATLVWLQEFTAKYDIILPEPYVINHHLDNKSVIQRVKKTCALQRQVPNHQLLPDHDVVVEIAALWHALPVHVQFQWVRGHQDSSQPAASLSLEAQLNCEADYQANQIHITGNPAVEIIPRLPHTPCQLVINQRSITSHIKQSVYDAATIPVLIKYCAQKYQWEDSVVQTIDWTNFQGLIRKYKNSWTTIVKHLHDISPTGKIAHRNNSTLPHECPACGSPQEDNIHVITCPSSSREQWRQLLFKEVSRLEGPSSDPYLLDILQDGLHRLHKHLPPPLMEHYPERYHQLLQRQEKIGWHQLYKGRWSVDWKELQDQFNTSKPPSTNTMTGSQWVLKSSRLLLDQWMKVWQIRNHERHGRDDIEKTQRQETVIKAALGELYAFKDLVCPSDRTIFHSSIDDHMTKHTTAQIEQWINTYREAIKASVDQAKRLGIQRNRGLPLSDYKPSNPNQRPSQPAGLATG